ncbi:hypothetical protein BCR37DRAFT_382061 [Protomyces lactucae-debilis]|uniref:DUF7492 domain-containing protein n=1 Tax=Protomyces lactucae-debilis TaxID=2754530 RepID=A0A1Y2F829_PROLT|nr:uncharacterized protein BCR37DRAFT_382061 [Protomyces lactucae-debilis]ORY79075.1 hypothetical protein BCR37DRAFT_382061 [Protomyces lactucae-debilis]
MSYKSLCALLLMHMSGLTAHSWIDNLAQVGNLSNVGYIRGYGGHIDALSTFQINNLSPSTQLCKSNQQAPAYTSQFPMLVLPAGQSFIANYSENGHVTKDKLAPDNLPHPGNYTWYLQSASQSLKTLNDLNTAQIVATGNYDDGLCAEDATRGRAGPRQCQSQVQLPTTLAQGTYQLVWLWQFPKVAGVVEMYSSCMDVQVTQPALPAGQAVAVQSAAMQVNQDVRAVSSASAVPASPRLQAEMLVDALSALLVFAKGQAAALNEPTVSTPVAPAVPAVAQAAIPTPSMTTLTKLVIAQTTRKPANPLIDAY